MAASRKTNAPRRPSSPGAPGKEDANRKLIRPRITTYRTRPSSGMSRTRTSPPEQTNAETNYLIKQMETRTPMVVKMMDGEEIRGWIEYYDRHCIKINSDRPPNFFIRKEHILYMYKDPSSRRRRDRDH